MGAWQIPVSRRFRLPSGSLIQGLTLFTYDRRTIPPLLKGWTEEDRPHAGVIFGDEKTTFPADIGGLVKALGRLVKEPAPGIGPTESSFCDDENARSCAHGALPFRPVALRDSVAKGIHGPVTD
jgi:hypothetical protein